MRRGISLGRTSLYFTDVRLSGNTVYGCMQGGIVAVGVAFPGSRLDVRGNQLQAVAERMREFKERLPQIADKARADLEAASALNAFQARGLAQLDKDLEDLLKLFA